MTDERTTELPSTVLVLGGGIHGAAVARELILNGISVVLADTGDLAQGATSKSSRLIHGGLRYLEYGDVRLVRESLQERERLLKLAPHLVHPLRLSVPISHRWSGLLRSAIGFFRLARTRFGRRLMSRSERRAPRGFWPVRLGLWMYDLFSWSDGLPKSSWSRVRSDTHPQVDPQRYRWLCAYYDTQMRFPERCVMALLADAEQAARGLQVSLQIVTYATLNQRGSEFTITGRAVPPIVIRPELVVNTSGAWGDLTLRNMESSASPLFCGTKGSHFVTRNADLISKLRGQGVYAETSDRRLAFILPFGDSVLVGTTDEEWTGIPDHAVASEEELCYLLQVVDTVMGLKLGRDDIESHYSGVRPLPLTTETSNAAISRDSALVEHRLHGVKIVTLVGGKLTTFRAVAEQISSHVLKKLRQPRTVSTANRILCGGEDFSRDPAVQNDLWRTWAKDYGTTLDEVKALWPLYGMRTRTILADVAPLPAELVADTPFFRRTACWIIQHEWVTTIDDLVERRLLLIFADRLSVATLRDLADCLTVTHHVNAETVTSMVDATRRRLEMHYGRPVTD